MRTKHIEGFIDRYVVYEDGRVWSQRSKNFLKAHDIGNGYYSVKLYKEGRNYNRFVHRIVAQAFIPQEDKLKSFVNHIDGNKANNHVSNLEWLTRKENIAHAHREGLMNQSRKGGQRLSEEKAQEILNLKGTTSQVKIAKMFNVGVATVWDIHNRRTWRNLKGNVPV